MLKLLNSNAAWACCACSFSLSLSSSKDDCLIKTPAPVSLEEGHDIDIINTFSLDTKGSSSQVLLLLGLQHCTFTAFPPPDGPYNVLSCSLFDIAVPLNAAWIIWTHEATSAESDNTSVLPSIVIPDWQHILTGLRQWYFPPLPGGVARVRC